MTVSPNTQFAQRYLLAHYPSGGVVVDLESGNYFRINRSAALICEALRSERDRADAAVRVSQSLGISTLDAEEAISDVVTTLAGQPLRGEIQGSYHFFPSETGYALWHGERRVLEVDARSRDIRLASREAPPRATQLELYLRALAPKLLFQSGVTVLHASACVLSSRLVAFAGFSRAGKTTTARAFRDAGSRLLSEDLVVLTPRAPAPSALVNGEPFVQSWAREVAARLLAAPGDAADSSGVNGVLEGPSMRLDQILFLDQTRRTGNDFVTAPLAEPDALTTLMTHDFLGAAAPDAWRRFFETARSLVGGLDIREASAPNGVELLMPAAGRYISRTAS